MEPSQLTWNAGYIWGIADDVLRDLDNGLADDLLDGDEPMDDTHVRAWNERKEMFPEQHICQARDVLRREGWLATNETGR